MENPDFRAKPGLIVVDEHEGSRKTNQYAAMLHAGVLYCIIYAYALCHRRKLILVMLDVQVFS
jgi:hypothetical protein